VNEKNFSHTTDFARWVVSLDDLPGTPGAEERRSGTLARIIDRARAALDASLAAERDQLLAAEARFDERIADLQAEYLKREQSWDRTRERLTGERDEARQVARQANNNCADFAEVLGLPRDAYGDEMIKAARQLLWLHAEAVWHRDRLDDEALKWVGVAGQHAQELESHEVAADDEAAVERAAAAAWSAYWNPSEAPWLEQSAARRTAWTATIRAALLPEPCGECETTGRNCTAHARTDRAAGMR
jgi:hypothetical protein